MQSPHGVKFSAFRPSVMGRNGMVTSGHPLASQAGIQTMMAGGNAVDAAIATAAALGVVEPHSSGVGGDGFILIHWAATGETTGVNATGPAPYAANRDLYLQAGGIPMKGIRSVSVPGIVDGWLKAHERYGALTLDRVFDPAISVCENGFPVSHNLAGGLRAENQRFADDLHQFQRIICFQFPGAFSLVQGGRFQNADLDQFVIQQLTVDLLLHSCVESGFSDLNHRFQKVG